MKVELKITIEGSTERGVPSGAYMVKDPLEQPQDSYPSCPSCGNGHAMIETWHPDWDDLGIKIQVCRDCNHIHCSPRSER